MEQNHDDRHHHPVHAVLLVILGALGAVIVVATVLSAAQTLAVPRATPLLITRWVFVAAGSVLRGTRRIVPRRRGEQLLALYAPMSLLTLPLVWLALVLVGFGLLFTAVGENPADAFLESGSSLLTLGFREPSGVGPAALAFLEAFLGLGLVALLVSYLPSIYASYSRRELMVTGLESLAGTPPSAVDLLVRLARIHGFESLGPFWDQWSHWFADVEETHCSTPSLVYFRSPQPERSWVTAAGAVMDAAALVSSTLDLGRRPAAELCLRSGYLTLRRVGDFFAIPHDPDPSPTDPISVTRAEFDAARAELAAAGAPLRPDVEQAWRDFAGWRVNYDGVLLRFAGLVEAPTAPWSGDRALPFRSSPWVRR
ncbi:hypothetical protein [Actinomycetospora chiangmaiensis]|uniref:hypothetical protein n=1 Tax=Actinomycetospora chiangmaiensis TaxID=402650 RepID=UPI00037F8D64|nr:hypothetical protein [Actinomycetospora chiangmaiensis]